MRRCGVSWKRNSLHSWQENVINRGLSYCHLLWKKKKKKEVKRPEQSAMKGPLFFCIILCLYWSLFPVSTGTLVLFIYIKSINIHCRTRQLSIYPQLVLRRRLNFIHDLIMKALDCILKPHDAISSWMFFSSAIHLKIWITLHLFERRFST